MSFIVENLSGNTATNSNTEEVLNSSDLYNELHSLIDSQLDLLPQERKSPNLDNAVFFCAFLVTNILIFNACISFIPFYSVVSHELKALYGIVTAIFSLPLAIFCIKDMLINAFAGLKDKYVSSDFCYSFAVVAYICCILYALVMKPQSLIDQTEIFSLTFVVAFVVFARKVETELLKGIKAACGFDVFAAVPSVRKLDPELMIMSAEKSSSGIEQSLTLENLSQVGTKSVKIGDVLLLGSGETVPCDGIILSGKAQIKERRFTACLQYKHKARGDEIFAGTEILSGNIVYKVVGLLEDSAIATFSAALNKKLLESYKTGTLRQDQSITIINLMITSVALCAFVFWSTKTSDFGGAAQIFTAILFLSFITKIIPLKPLLKILCETKCFAKSALASDGFIIDKLAPVKRLIFDYSVSDQKKKLKVKDFNLIDSRIEKKSLFSVIYAVLVRANSQIFTSINEYIAASHPNIEVLEIKEFDEYETYGIAGSVNEADISIGTEDFLLERGVVLQEAELQQGRTDETGRLVYVAVNDELVGYFEMSEGFIEDLAVLTKKLKSNSVRSVLCSTAAGEDLDAIGQKIGLELSDIYGSLTLDAFTRKINDYKPCCLICDEKTEKALIKTSDVGIAFFNEYLWDINRSDICLFNKNYMAIADTFHLAKRSLQINFLNNLISVGVLLAAVIPAVLGLIPPVFVVTIGCLSVIYATYSLYRLASY